MSDLYDNDEIEKDEKREEEMPESRADDTESSKGRDSSSSDSDSDGEDFHKDKKESEYEDVCFICRRPESKTGKMFKLPNNISVCNDCMHKTMDTVSQFDYQGMLNNTPFENMNKNGKGFPNISFVNIADLQGEGGIPNKQKLKKRSEKKREKPVLDIKNIPAPHRKIGRAHV